MSYLYDMVYLDKENFNHVVIGSPIDVLTLSPHHPPHF